MEFSLYYILIIKSGVKIFNMLKTKIFGRYYKLVLSFNSFLESDIMKQFNSTMKHFIVFFFNSLGDKLCKLP